MKKSSILILLGLGAVSLSTLAISNLNTNEPKNDLVYKAKSYELAPELRNPFRSKNEFTFLFDVDDRFLRTQSKTQILNAKSVRDVFPAEKTEGIASFYDVNVIRLSENMDETKIHGNDENFTADQIALLKGLDYSNNFYVTADYRVVNPETGTDYGERIVYFMTVVPETEANYPGGMEALNAFLEKGSKREIQTVEKEYLKPGRIYFEVGTDGLVDQVRLSNSCGYPEIDAHMQDLLRGLPKKFESAKDSEGHAVAQTLVFFYGMKGC